MVYNKNDIKKTIEKENQKSISNIGKNYLIFPSLRRGIKEKD